MPVLVLYSLSYHDPQEVQEVAYGPSIGTEMSDLE